MRHQALGSSTDDITEYIVSGESRKPYNYSELSFKFQDYFRLRLVLFSVFLFFLYIDILPYFSYIILQGGGSTGTRRYKIQMLSVVLARY